MTQHEVDIMFMRRCLQLAANGLGRTRPNPLVGCVVVDGNGHIVSEGYHQEYGGGHAERNALLRAELGGRRFEVGGRNSELGGRSSEGGARRVEALSTKPNSTLRPPTSNLQPPPSNLLPPPSDLTLYVNLEPCSHHGLTPPCADLIVERGIRRVVCCNDDPNPLVAGRGFAKLQKAGIEVVRHVLESEGRHLNRRFFTFIEKQRPYIILKWAQSADGFLAPDLKPPRSNLKYWLSTPAQNRLNHRWRTEEAAILVGSETYLLDRPSLNARHYLGPQPQPVVLDRRGRVSVGTRHAVSAEEPTATDTARRVPIILRSQTVEEAMHELHERKLQSVIVEGGRQVLDAFLDAGLYDEIRILRSPRRLGSGLPAPTPPESADLQWY